ncbi:chaperonin 10-like protein [Phyllosticta capitalensis]|uniref:chaperonin 10-like protein n=1 Tax=Phyllosticta capitalensis TaxID=121624 RepID=UPI003130D4F9
MSSSHHLAAMLTKVRSALEISRRPTPTPGPNELLIDVKAIALNPVDRFQRASGFHISHAPAVLGSDVAGVIIASGSSVTNNNASLKPGTRVAAFAPCFFKDGEPDYGAMQQRVLVPAANAVPLPDGISLNEAALLPMAVATAWLGWYTIGLPIDTSFTPADKQGMLVWGGASSIGSAAVQTARAMGFIVYATASPKHHAYLQSLGATRVFDYKAAGVEQAIIDAARHDGVALRTGYDAVGQLKSCLDVLKDFKGDDVAKLAEAVRMNDDSPRVDGVVAKFIAAAPDARERDEQFRFVFNVWLKERLASGEFVPSPKVRVVEGGLEAANDALDILKEGVSGEKLVLEV